LHEFALNPKIEISTADQTDKRGWEGKIDDPIEEEFVPPQKYETPFLSVLIHVIRGSLLGV